MRSLEEIKREIAALPNTYIFYTGKEIRYLPQILADDEHVLALTSGYMNNRTWLAVCTTQRVLFVDRGMFFGLRQIQMNLDRIQAIDSNFGLAFGGFRVWDGASAIQIGMVLKSTVAPFVKTVQEAMDRYKRTMVHDIAHAATTVNRSTHAPASADFIYELERLSKMRAEGHLSDAEFAIAKTKLLGDQH